MARFVEWLRRNQNVVFVTLTGFLVPVITDLLSSWLQGVFGQTPTQVIKLLAVLAGLSILLWGLALILRKKSEPVNLVPREAQPPRCKGLIALVGPGRPGADPMDQSAVKAIEYHLADDGPLQVCWLIASAGAKGGVPVAEQIEARYASRCKVIVRRIGDAFSVQDTYDAVQEIYNVELYDETLCSPPLTPEQVIADFTGGTRMMSAGMVLACGKDRPMQYMTGKQGMIASTPMLVQFKPKPRRRKR